MTIRPRQNTEETRTRCSESRRAALAEGATTYSTGFPCRNGHAAPRTTANGTCTICNAEKRKQQYWADPESARARVRDYTKTNPERAKATRQRTYWKNPEKPRERARLRAQAVRAATQHLLSDEPQTCTMCGETKPADNFSKDIYRKSGRKGDCKPCVALAWGRFRQTPNYDKRIAKAKFTRHELKKVNPALLWARRTKNNVVARAKLRGETTDVTVAWLLTQISETCPLLGIPLKYDNTWMAPDSAALDRIDNTVGYRQSNCWVISTKGNRIKTDATLEEIETVARNFRAAMTKRVDDLV